MKIKYKIGNNECIGNVPYGATILNARIIQQSNEGYFEEALIYLPPIIEYEHKGEKHTDKGCGAISFAIKSKKDNIWERSPNDYMNLPKRHKFEQKKRKVKS